jgi:prophage regulatory protein
MSAANTDHMLTRREVESMICVSCATIYRWVQEGTFPGPVKFTARCVRWRQSEVQNWIDSRTQVAA